MRLEKGDEEYFAYKDEQRRTRVAVRLLLDHYRRATVKALHAERDTDEHRKAEALVESLTTVIVLLDPSGAISQGDDK